MHNVNRPIDTKRDEYRKYLERTGVLQAISRTLTKLYEERDKPTDAVGFVFDSIAEFCDSRKDIEEELSNERLKNKNLTEELEEIKAAFAAYKKAEADAVKDEDAMLADSEEITSASSTVPVIPESASAVSATAVPPTEPVAVTVAISPEATTVDVVAAPPPVAPASVPSESASLTTPATQITPPTTAPSVGSVDAVSSTPSAADSASAAIPSEPETTDVTMTEVTSNSA